MDCAAKRRGDSACGVPATPAARATVAQCPTPHLARWGATTCYAQAMHFLVTRDRAGRWHWRLLMTDLSTIAKSVLDYASRAACEDGIDLVRITNSGTPVRYTSPGEIAE